MRLNPLRYIILLAFMAVAVTGCEQNDDHVTLKLAHGLDTGHSVHKAMVFMDQRLRELSGGTMSIDIYPSGQLGSERDLMELLQIGSLAMTKVSTSPMESFVPQMKVFSIPYVFRDQAHLWQVLDGEIGQELLLAGQSVRLRGLAYYDAGSRSFYTIDTPIRKPSDLKGLKIRVMKSKTSMLMVNALGGSATPISFGELYTALQQGVVDGAENNPPSFYLSKHYEVARYYTLDMHTSVPDILLMSGPVWNKLSPEQQAWLQEAARLSVPYQKALWKQSSDEALQAVKDAGVTVIEPDKTAFQQAVKGMHDSYRGQPVYDLMQRIANVKGDNSND
ncbi:MAG: TRAP transporter substrate-binding protein DctP [Alphaproteobacteria bacterium]|nr:MAG: TRAP transporter substrate-binding protein DctP [Alphaproteobacteria bacterium]